MPTGAHGRWGCHLELGTNLLIDAFLQDKSWADELVRVVDKAGARLLLVGVRCDVAELERREAQRGDRPLGLARRSLDACHAHGLRYDVELNTDQQPTEDSVAAIIAALLRAEPAPAPTSTPPLTHRSGTELVGLLRTGAVTSAELLEAFLARVAAKNASVNAVVVLDAAGARARAADLDRLRAEGAELGPLHGQFPLKWNFACQHFMKERPSGGDSLDFASFTARAEGAHGAYVQYVRRSARNRFGGHRRQRRWAALGRPRGQRPSKGADVCTQRVSLVLTFHLAGLPLTIKNHPPAALPASEAAV